jgi:hypothetical protein
MIVNRGILPPDYRNQGECDTGYQGFLCTDCQINYARKGKLLIVEFKICIGFYECSPCPNKTANAFKIIGLLVLLFVLLFFTVRFTIKNAKEGRATASVYLRIFLNHSQLIVLTASFQLDWPSIVIIIKSAIKN